ncbi:MAG: ATP-dependent RNA helicase HrpA [Proteobacteria bacterium]|nr:MAG: ATP-dependent RNA helicase HrpA [Pseudomonadota bacterium]
MAGRVERPAPFLSAQSVKRRSRRNRRKPGSAVARKPGPVPEVSFPAALPISERAGEIATMLREHQVVVVAGETGSGKSTQIPKICLARCVDLPGMIAHTQPRRIAAREVASRVASEIGSRLGDIVGYKVRFGERTGPGTRVKVLTDGMLLAEMERDRDLVAYHTVIVDEAHERSVNIDFILGYLKRLLRKRPEFRVVVTSATIDTARFSRHFDDCPVLEVSGRTYPVDVVYRPVVGDADGDSLFAGIESGVRELWRHGPGDVLVFLPGEREIRDAGAYLAKRLGEDVEFLPLFARLSPADQKRIFRPSAGRRVVLSTNVAETSLTVPGVRYVIDSGLARVSRFSATRKVQRLPIEKVSQAAANQRKGRCGRVQSGICIRLYSEEDFLSRSEFTDPEIRRTSLASIVLKMKALNLGDIGDFPFVEAPDARQIRSAVRLLHEIGALNERERLTRTGWELARLPVEPRVGRLLIEGARQGCLEEMLVVASRLAAQDPQVYPQEQLDKARRHHAAIPEASSDIDAAIVLFDAYRRQARESSRRAVDRWCQSMYLSPMRMREWSDLYEQLHGLMLDNHQPSSAEPAEPERIAIAFLSGYLGNIAFLDDKGVWRGGNGKTVSVHPSSRSFRKKPRWFVAAEFVDTGKLYARHVLPVRAEWIEKAAGRMVKVHYTEPWWDEGSGNVMSYKSGSLFGITLYSRRRAHFGPVDGVAARTVFINEALVPARMSRYFAFARDNRALREEATRARQKLRLAHLDLDDQALAEYFDTVLPEKVNSRATLKHALRADCDLEQRLRAPRALVLDERGARHESTHPERIHDAGASLSVAYAHEPGAPGDGVTVDVPLPMLNQFDADACARQIPGWFEQQVEALLRALPKARRRALQPLAGTAAELAAALRETSGGVVENLVSLLASRHGVITSREEFDSDRVPEYLRLRIALVDSDGRLIDSGRDVETLRRRHREKAEKAFSETGAAGYPRRGVKAWNFGDLDEAVAVSGYGTRVRAYPALVDRGDRVDIELVDNADRARETHVQGVRRLVRFSCRRVLKDVSRINGLPAMAVKYAGLYPNTGFLDRFEDALVEQSTNVRGNPPRRQEDFEKRVGASRGRLPKAGRRMAGLVGLAIERAYEVRRLLDDIEDRDFLTLVELRLAELIGPGFPFVDRLCWLPHVPRFVQALASRVAKFRQNPASETDNASRLEPFLLRLRDLSDCERNAHGVRFRFLLEEFQVSLFAQNLKTSEPVSPKRLEREWSRIAER